MKTAVALAVTILGLIGSGCAYSGTDEKRNEQLLLTLATRCSAPAPCSPTAQSPAFSTLATAGTTSACSSCHSGATLNAGFDVTNYSAWVARISKGSASCSLAYQKITTGTMAPNSTSTINQAVFNWIQGCAAP